MQKLNDFINSPIGLVATFLVAAVAGYTAAQYFSVVPAASSTTTK